MSSSWTGGTALGSLLRSDRGSIFLAGRRDADLGAVEMARWQMVNRPSEVDEHHVSPCPHFGNDSTCDAGGTSSRRASVLGRAEQVVPWRVLAASRYRARRAVRPDATTEVEARVRLALRHRDLVDCPEATLSPVGASGSLQLQMRCRVPHRMSDDALRDCGMAHANDCLVSIRTARTSETETIRAEPQREIHAVMVPDPGTPHRVAPVVRPEVKDICMLSRPEPIGEQSGGSHARSDPRDRSQWLRGQVRDPLRPLEHGLEWSPDCTRSRKRPKFRVAARNRCSLLISGRTGESPFRRSVEALGDADADGGLNHRMTAEKILHTTLRGATSSYRNSTRGPPQGTVWTPAAVTSCYVAVRTVCWRTLFEAMCHELSA